MTRRAALAASSMLALGIGPAGTVRAQGQATPDASPAVGSGGTRTVEHAQGTTEIPASPQRVLALGEEFLLADLLTLGLPVVASSATVASEGFVGLDRFDTSGIEPIDATEPDLERLVAIAPDLIVTGAYIWDQAGEAVLAPLAPTIVIEADGGDWRSELLTLGEMFDAADRAQAALDGYDTAVTGARETLATEGRTVSIATIYPGDAVAVWIDGPVNIPQTVLDLGFTLEPGPGSLPEAQNGRAFISLEQLALLTGDDLLALQSDLVEGEQEAFDAFLEQPLWQSLLAVAAGRVHVLDRLGYPGVAGRTRLVADLMAALSAR